MKKIQIIDTYRRIKRTKVTFLSILFIISLGVSTYLGINFAEKSMVETGNDYYVNEKFHDFEVNYQYGLNQEDLNAITNLDSVTEAEGGYATTGFLSVENQERLVTVQSFTDEVDKCTVVEGRLPEAPNEIAIEQLMVEEDGIKIGDLLDINCSEKDGSNYLKETKFKVVGVVTQPSYTCNYVYSRRGISNKGNGNCLNYLIVSKEAFNKQLLNNSYTSIYIRMDELNKYNTFSKEYKDRSDDFLKEIESVASSRSKIRYDELVASNTNVNSDIKNPSWKILSRDGNPSYKMYGVNAEGLGKLSLSFAFVYIAVALMVSYSSIGRMIGEQRNLIGTQKALGYKKLEILNQYLIYSFWATFFGVLWGVGFAIFIVEKISLNSYKQVYFFQEYNIVWDLKLIAIITIAAILLTSLATILGCRKIINTKTVQLLTYEIPKVNRRFSFEKLKVFKRMSLFNRTVIKNIFNDKTHAITTIIGIAGCTALMIIGFTLTFTFKTVNKNQFTDIQRFDQYLVVSNENADGKTNAKNYLDNETNVKYLELMDNLVAMEVNKNDNIMIDLLCSDSLDINEYFKLESPNINETVEIPSEGVLLSSNTASYYGIKENDFITILNSNGEKSSVKVVGLVNNYVCHFMVISPQYYEEVTGQAINNNTFFIKLNGTDVNSLKSNLENIDGYRMLAGKEMGISIFENISESLNSVVQILIFLSGVMALVVLLNLSIMYINEKSRTLSIMRINGYTLKEAKAFILRGDVVLFILGLIIGTVIGIVIGDNIVSIIETDSVAYTHTPSLLACVLSCSINIIFYIIIKLISNRRINKLPLNNVNATD